MQFTYSPLEILIITIYRKFFPVQKSSYTLWEVEDICSINLVPPQDLEEFFTKCITTLQEVKWEDIWSYLEFGVFNGSSIWSMVKASKKLDINIDFYWFDAYEWLPAWAENEDDWVWKKWFYTCSFEKMQSCLRRRDVNPDDITRINWRYENTLTKETTQKYNISNLWIVFIDCDTYSSSKTVLDFIWPLIKQPVIFCFDDWKLNDLDIKQMWEYKAFNEFLAEYKNIHATSIKSYNRKSRSFLVTPKK